MAEGFPRPYIRPDSPEDIVFTPKQNVLQLCAKSDGMATFLKHSLEGAVFFAKPVVDIK
jgi:hypothetical protein